MTERALELGHEVYLVDPDEHTIRVALQPSWGLVPGSRSANATRSFATRTQTASTATSSVGIIGSVVFGGLWLLLVSSRWLAFHVRRRHDWTVSVSWYETEPVTLAGRGSPVAGRSVRTVQVARHPDFAAALRAAKEQARTLAESGYRRLAHPVGWRN